MLSTSANNSSEVTKTTENRTSDSVAVVTITKLGDSYAVSVILDGVPREYVTVIDFSVAAWYFRTWQNVYFGRVKTSILEKEFESD